MPHFVIPQTWTTRTENRTCGSCTACCTYLGVEELHKYSGQKCRHLLGPASGSKRCSIYKQRPAACSGYYCIWLAGWGPDNLRPKDSGILLTGYPSERGGPSQVSITANVFNLAKARPHISQLLGELMSLPSLDELRLIYLESRKATMFRDGFVYDCELLAPDPGDYEALQFMAHEPPVGRYAVQLVEQHTSNQQQAKE